MALLLLILSSLASKKVMGMRDTNCPEHELNKLKEANVGKYEKLIN